MRVTILAVVLAGLLALLPAWLPWLKTPVILAMCNGLAVLGVIVLIRAGQVSFGNAMFACVGGYAVVFAARAWQLDGLLLLALGTLAATVAGGLAGLFMVRYRGIFFGMLNLAISMVLYSLLEKLYDLTKGTDGIRVARATFAGLDLPRETQEWLMFLIALALAAVFGTLIAAYLRSPMGRALAGIKTRETRLEFLGVSARRVLLFAYVASAVLGGIAGTLVALTTRHVTPLLGYWTSSGELVFIAILGGAGSAVGAFLGAVAFELVRVYAAASVADAWQMILGGVLLLVILFAPGGLWGIIAGRLKVRA